MKKMSNKRRLWFFRIRKKRAKRTLQRRNKKIIIQCFENCVVPSDGHKIKSLRITGPKVLGFRERKDRRKLLFWLKKLRSITLDGDQPVYIDFTYSKDAEPLGFLLLLAEIDSIQSIKGKRYVTAIGPRDKVAAQLFHQIGLAQMVRIKRSSEKITSDDVKFWHHLKGTEIDTDKAGQLIVQLSKDYGLDNESAMDLFGGVSEAMTNTIMHAYEYSRGNGYEYGKNKWWMFTSIKNGLLTVVICDIGIGIPRSLKNQENHPDIYGKVISLFKAGEDSKLIKVAIEEGRTKSKKSHRGLGMSEMKKFISGIGKGNLVIMSNKGMYLYQGEKDTEGQQDFTSSIMGTMVGWTVPVEALEITH